MIIIAAVDNRNGMMFNKRRQSRDRVLNARILGLAKSQGVRLWMNAYSYKLFEPFLMDKAGVAEGTGAADKADGVDITDMAGCVAVDEDFPVKAAFGDYCFLENVSPASISIDKIEKVILYKWNREYPGDVYFDIDLASAEWKMTSTTDFEGSSHEMITEEVYERNS